MRLVQVEEVILLDRQRQNSDSLKQSRRQRRNLMTFDGNGEINHACVVGEGRFTVSSSEFVEARKAREAKHAEYEKLAEKSALKRKILEQEIEERYYKRNLVTQAAFNAYEKNIVEL